MDEQLRDLNYQVAKLNVIQIEKQNSYFSPSMFLAFAFVAFLAVASFASYYFNFSIPIVLIAIIGLAMALTAVFVSNKKEAAANLEYNDLIAQQNQVVDETFEDYIDDIYGLEVSLSDISSLRKGNWVEVEVKGQSTAVRLKRHKRDWYLTTGKDKSGELERVSLEV